MVAASLKKSHLFKFGFEGGEMNILDFKEMMCGGVPHLESAAHLYLTVICGAIQYPLG
jgi:hypothetical protein